MMIFINKKENLYNLPIYSREANHFVDIILCDIEILAIVVLIHQLFVMKVLIFYFNLPLSNQFDKDVIDFWVGFFFFVFCYMSLHWFYIRTFKEIRNYIF